MDKHTSYMPMGGRGDPPPPGQKKHPPRQKKLCSTDTIRGRGQILREVGPNFCFKEGDSKNCPGRGIKIFFQGGGWVGEGYIK